MDLWKNLDKITAQLQKSSVKVLMLDFDGTLTPIVKNPSDAKLSAEARNLLQEMCQKPNFYLAIISGRKLTDIKKRIGLAKMIYGGDHGLEGEIFGKEYSFPVPKQIMTALRNIRKQLVKIANQYQGAQVENKDHALSFHYRSVATEQLQEVISLFKITLKPFIKNKLVFTITGKKVIDIVPNVHWNKGCFADLIIRKITDQTSKIPLAIVIGDDKTDENIFQSLKNGITIVVGKKAQSKAKYYLNNPKEVVQFLKILNTIKETTSSENYFTKLRQLKKLVDKKDFHNPDFLEFWKGLIRDSTGRWLAYYYKGVKYFKYGKQSKPDLNDKLQLALIKSSIKHEQAFLNGLNNRSFKNLKQWLIQLHYKQSYFGVGGQILLKRRISQGEHTQIIIGSVLPLARKYNDLYTNKGTQIVHLPGIDLHGCPMDSWKDNQVIHYYPDPKYFNQYLKVMREKLEQFILKIDRQVDGKTLEIIASYYQYGINMHMFENVNQSLFTNQANAMLKLLGLKPIEHGILDFVAMRLQPKNFLNYFIDEVNYSA